MNILPQPPIITYNKGDLVIFNLLGEAESYIEAIDVRNNEYIVFDSLGNILDFEIQYRKNIFGSGSEQVKLFFAENGVNRINDLLTILLEYIIKIQ